MPKYTGKIYCRCVGFNFYYCSLAGCSKASAVLMEETGVGALDAAANEGQSGGKPRLRRVLGLKRCKLAG